MPGIRSGLWLAGLVVGVAACPAVASAATTWCVNNPPCVAAGGNGSQSTIGGATGAALSGDTVSIGAGTYPEHPTDGGKSLTIVGAGPTQTIVQPPAATSTTTFALSGPTSSISRLGLVLAAGNTNEGLSFGAAGESASNVAVSAPAGDTSGEVGVALGFGSFTAGSVVLPITGTTTGVATTGGGSLADSSITAVTGVFGVATIARVRITANVGIQDQAVVGSFTGTIDDALILAIAGASSPVGISATAAGVVAGGSTASLTARHVTVIGNGDPTSVGVAASASAPIFPANSSVTLDSSLVRGFGHSLSESTTTSSASSSLSVDYSDYDPSTVSSTNTGGGTGSVSQGSHSINVDPVFAATSTSASDPATPNEFTLQTPSPTIDAGDPAALVAGESTTDLAGNPRVVAGRAGATARTDMGAFEYQPHPPTAAATASPTSVQTNVPVAFTGVGSDPDPGDSVSYAWTFDDGGTATGATASHGFTTAGAHTATLTVTDRDNLTATATTQVNVTAPSPPPTPTPTPTISGLRLSKQRISIAGRKVRGKCVKQTAKNKHNKPCRLAISLKVAYRLNATDPITFTLTSQTSGRKVKGKCVKPTKKNRNRPKCTISKPVPGSITHASAAGANSLTWKIGGKKLGPGTYVLTATPAGGKAQSVKFQIVR